MAIALAYAKPKRKHMLLFIMIQLQAN